MHLTPGDALPDDDKVVAAEDDNPDVRISQALEDKLVEPVNEFYDDDQDNDKESQPKDQ